MHVVRGRHRRFPAKRMHCPRHYPEGKMQVMISIFNYVNYRRFLKDYYLKAKAEKKCFSYRYFSRRAGINSPNFLKVVIEGKRNLSSTTIEKFASALGLDQKETVFFRRLVVFNQARTVPEKQESYIILREMANQMRQDNQGADIEGLINKWYSNAVREIMTETAGRARLTVPAFPSAQKGSLHCGRRSKRIRAILPACRRFRSRFCPC